MSSNVRSDVLRIVSCAALGVVGMLGTLLSEAAGTETEASTGAS
jgi:hypothetical protein